MSPEKSTLDQLRIDRNAPAKKASLGWVGPVVIVVLVLGAVLGWWLTRTRAAEVKTITAFESSTGGSKTVLNASGYVVARREATVSSKVTGKVIEIFVEEGMKAKEGQILARLDASNIKANLDLADAQLDAARSALNETKVRVDEAEKELRRTTGLAQEKVASTADLEHAQAEANSIKARLERQQVEVTVAERQVALWRQQMDDTTIRAPFAGIVTSKNAQPGEMISPMSAGGFTRTGICTLVDMESLEIEIDVNESYINRVTPGQPVTATLDAYADSPIPAKVIAIIPTADRQKATVKVRVGIEKLDSRILPQMGVKVAFQASEQAAAAVSRGIAIPKASIHKKDGRDFVWIIQKGRAEQRAVTLGNSRGDEVVVQSGLAAGEKVVIEGAEKLIEGDPVQEAKK